MFYKKQSHRKNIKSLMETRLQESQMTLLSSIAQIADCESINVYVVGGFVRDLMLNIRNFDIDLVVEGSGVDFAEILSKKFNGFVKSHPRFGTSVVTLRDHSKIDVAMARKENYSYPGALPKVESSSIDNDLSRRDFTVNSMAVKLNGEESFCLIDFFNSETDLRAGTIRVLHDQSFVEDPSRIFRAIRFEQRFKFSIEDQTEFLIKDAIKNNMVEKLSGTRLMNEVKLILSESDPVRCIDRMRELCLLESFVPDTSGYFFYRLIIKQIKNVLVWTKNVSFPKNPEIWFVYLHILFLDTKQSAFDSAVKRLCLSTKISKKMRLDREHFDKARCSLNEERELKPSEIYGIFSEMSSEAVVLLIAACYSERVIKYATLYFNQYYSMAKTRLTGDDLIKMGVEPGPIFDDVFKTLRDARVNGQVTSRDEEVVLVVSKFLQ